MAVFSQILAACLFASVSRGEPPSVPYPPAAMASPADSYGPPSLTGARITPKSGIFEPPAAKVSFNLFRPTSSRRPQADYGQRITEESPYQKSTGFIPTDLTELTAMIPRAKYGIPEEALPMTNLKSSIMTESKTDRTLMTSPRDDYGPPSMQLYTTYDVLPSSSGPYGIPKSDIHAHKHYSSEPKSFYGIPIVKQENYEMNETPNYDFVYEVKVNDGNNFGHEESWEGSGARGKYHVLLPDGRMQIVKYTANKEGYKPMITFEEGSHKEGPY